MLRSCRLTLAVALAALALTSASAGADWLRFSPARGFTATSLGAVTFDAGGVNIACDVTLTGTFVSGTIATTEGRTLASIARPAVDRECAVAMLSERSWSLAYRSEAGQLPDALTGINLTITNAAFLGTFLGISCLYGGNIETSMGLVEEEELPNPYDVQLTRLLGNQLPQVSGSESCPDEGSADGTFGLTAAQQVQAGPGLTWTPTPRLDWGDVVGAGPHARMYRITNNTGVNLTTSIVDTIGGGAAFTHDATDLGNGATINNGQSRDIDYSFAPTTVDLYIGHMRIRTTNNRTFLGRLRGNRTA